MPHTDCGQRVCRGTQKGKKNDEGGEIKGGMAIA